MPEITPLPKPEIWLVGDSVNADGTAGRFAGPVDHSLKIPTFATNVIEAEKTQFFENDVPVFQDTVRVIITARGCEIKASYVNPTRNLNSLEFEGNASFNTKADSSNITGRGGRENLIVPPGEVFYTLNGMDPRRQKHHLYNYLDLDSSDALNNLDNLGFVLGASNVGTDAIHLKARTFYDGKVSPVAAVHFKIHRNDKSVISS
jgi:hypothetical protein